jgi:hypothetical protein
LKSAVTSTGAQRCDDYFVNRQESHEEEPTWMVRRKEDRWEIISLLAAHVQQRTTKA